MLCKPIWGVGVYVVALMMVVLRKMREGVGMKFNLNVSRGSADGPDAKRGFYAGVDLAAFGGETPKLDQGLALGILCHPTIDQRKGALAIASSTLDLRGKRRTGRQGTKVILDALFGSDGWCQSGRSKCATNG